MMYFRYGSASLLLAAAAQSVSQRYDGASLYNRRIEFVNESGKNLSLEWINPKTGDMIPLDMTLENGATVAFDSFVNHTFAVHESSRNETCENPVGDQTGCNVQFIKVSDNDEQVAVVKRGLEVVHQHGTTHDLAQSTTDQCKRLAHADLKKGYNPSDVMEQLAECLSKQLTGILQLKSEEIAFESAIRTSIANQLENHTCAEVGKQTSEPKEVRTWTHKNVTRSVYVMHERPASTIHVLEKFITPEECDAIQKKAEPILHRGTVANGKGGHKLSDHRKAWQAGIKVPWDKEKDGDLIARVMRRVYDYTNDAVGYNLTIEGQEDLMSIQYFGIGEGSTEPPDQYRPHCDGDCDGMPHKNGGRVATMVMYCDVPDVGGGTNFQQTNIFVRPELGAAAFFSYLDPKTMRKETGFTSHSGCPVVEGTKRIAVHWMRLGVDSDNPWSSFNTLTIRKGREEEEDC